jgi:predicted DNA-binding transcriptional regulator AlpA
MATELAGPTELAALLGVTRPTVYAYMNHDDFPLPVVSLPRRQLWRVKDVQRWAQRTLPLREGRPPKETT